MGKIDGSIDGTYSNYGCKIFITIKINLTSKSNIKKDECPKFFYSNVKYENSSKLR